MNQHTRAVRKVSLGRYELDCAGRLVTIERAGRGAFLLRMGVSSLSARFHSLSAAIAAARNAADPDSIWGGQRHEIAHAMVRGRTLE